jgi:hypothetical protein
MFKEIYKLLIIHIRAIQEFIALYLFLNYLLNLKFI